jgi:predicted HicB family RNase H-like nuclease
MKRIIDGKTYNTDTATLVARSWWNDWERGNVDMQGDLYVTRGGAFFVVVTEPGNHEARIAFEPMDREAVDKWLATGEVEVFDETIFQEPAEAAVEREPEATIYVRVPRSLKDRIAAGAKDDELSVNAWVMRCVERCAGRHLGNTMDGAGDLRRAHYIASTIDTDPDGYTLDQYREAIGRIRTLIAEAWGDLGLPRAKGKNLDEDVCLYADTLGDPGLSREWEPYQNEESRS